MKIRFRSAYQAEVDVIDYGLTFVSDEVKDVPDDVGLALLDNPNFSRAWAAEEAAVIPAPVSEVTEQPA